MFRGHKIRKKKKEDALYSNNDNGNADKKTQKSSLNSS